MGICDLKFAQRNLQMMLQTIQYHDSIPKIYFNVV